MRGYNSTIRRKQKICVRCGKMSWIFSHGRCDQCAKIEDTLERDEKEAEKIIEEENLQDLIADADAIFSKYIRLKYADEKGVVKCFTCNNKKHWTLIQNGHYIKRGHLYLRWDERNCRPQDEECNEYKSGNMIEFTKRLEEEHNGITEILTEEMRIVYKPTRDELRRLISSYTIKVNELKNKLKNQNKVI